jgi:hypothetical protein
LRGQSARIRPGRQVAAPICPGPQSAVRWAGTDGDQSVERAR